MSLEKLTTINGSPEKKNPGPGVKCKYNKKISS